MSGCIKIPGVHCPPAPKALTTKDTNPKDAVGSRKVPMSVVPPVVLAEVAVGMVDGARKYGRFNYRVAGVRGTVYYDAAMRHLMAWYEGQDIDPDSGLSHITKAITSLVVLRDSMIQGNWNDDRPPKTPEFMPILNDRVGQLLDEAKAQGLSPTHYTQQEHGRE